MVPLASRSRDPCPHFALAKSQVQHQQHAQRQRITCLGHGLCGLRELASFVNTKLRLACPSLTRRGDLCKRVPMQEAFFLCPLAKGLGQLQIELMRCGSQGLARLLTDRLGELTIESLGSL